MRCSSCEPLLDRYVEGTLVPRDMARVSGHLRTCPRCESLLTELRVVDALLATTAPVELAPNFTFAVMAEARTTPMRAHRPLSLWAVLTFYVVGAWIALSALYAALGGRVPYLAASRALAHAAAQNLGTLSATARGFSPATPFVLGGAIGILLLDALLLFGALFLYRAAHLRLAARAERSETL
ncbi:MAG: zf-HC2 domain-containing protein [Candidatus Aquilonibacter sp.]